MRCERRDRVPRQNSLAEMAASQRDVRLTSESGHVFPQRDLPMIWDADFMLGPLDAKGTDSSVLGEINVSSVFPMPDEAPAEIAHRVADRLQSKL